MKRTITTLGELEDGDLFYFKSDKDKIVYKCDMPVTHNKRHFTIHGIPAADSPAHINKPVIKIET